MTTPAPDPVAAWNAALDRLEADLDRAEELVRDPAAEPLPAWSPPDLGPMPVELLGRATELNRRQQVLARRLAAAMTANQRQRQYADKVSGATAAPTRPTYVDAAL